ncbi:MAG: glycerophosphodiester phosphodiesterase [Candidatus Lokiarchaeota archaeon]|nr:glycerophosphodiester phosphodiesterase [Candidatus Lokiarchaeota archaeon]
MLVFAHRGASGSAPDNTLKAFELAIAAGTFAIESDVQPTRDGALVFFHDSFVRVGKRVLLPSSWMPAAWYRSIVVGDGEHVPLVDEVFGHFDKARSLEKITWSIDVPNGVAFKRLVSIARSYGIGSRVQVCSTSCKRNVQWRRIAHDMVQVWSIRTKQIERLGIQRAVEACKACKVDVINIKLADVTADLVNEARAAGLKVYIWDVHDEARYKRAISFDPDAIYTNYPSFVIGGEWKS